MADISIPQTHGSAGQSEASGQKTSTCNRALAQALLRGTNSSWDEYVGSAEQLIAAGLVLPSQFPGEPGRGKYSASYRLDGCPALHQGGTPAALTVRRLSAKNFHVKVRASKAEAFRRRHAEIEKDAIDLRRRQAAEAMRRAKERADRDLAAIPSSHEDYRSRQITNFCMLLSIHRQYMQPTKFNGYSFDDATLRRFDKAAKELIAILEEGSTRFHAGRHTAAIAEIRAKVAKSDASLQAVLAAAVATVRAA